MENKCVSCIKDNVTGECYDVKDKVARQKINDIENQLTKPRWRHTVRIVTRDAMHVGERNIEIVYTEDNHTETPYTANTFKAPLNAIARVSYFDYTSTTGIGFFIPCLNSVQDHTDFIGYVSSPSQNGEVLSVVACNTMESFSSFYDEVTELDVWQKKSFLPP